EASFAPILKKDDGRIDWNRPASEIASRVRGFQPFPGSFTFVEDKRVVIWRAKAVEHSIHGSNLPGQIVSLDGTLIVAAGGGTYLGIDEIQFEGKRRVAASEAIRGGSLQVGKRFA
ncbi:MAG: methionyl-tRNA formyltransferase, partial [Acidobacteriota bacterium]